MNNETTYKGINKYKKNGINDEMNTQRFYYISKTLKQNNNCEMHK